MDFQMQLRVSHLSIHQVVFPSGPGNLDAEFPPPHSPHRKAFPWQVSIKPPELAGSYAYKGGNQTSPCNFFQFRLTRFLLLYHIACFIYSPL